MFLGHPQVGENIVLTTEEPWANWQAMPRQTWYIDVLTCCFADANNLEICSGDVTEDQKS